MPASERYGEYSSPFYGETKLQIAWDSTSLGLLKECQRKYYYTMIEGWRAKSESVHLTFGIHFHAALELYDKRRSLGDDYDEALDAAVAYCLEKTWDYETGEPWSPDHNAKTRENLLRSVIWYLEEYKNDA